MSEQQDSEISQIIDAGLEAILAGNATLEEILKQHPEQAELIRFELETAIWLVSKRSEVAARPGFIAASRKRVVERVKQEANQRGTKRMLFGFAWPKRLAFQMAAVVLILLVFLSSTGGVVSAAQTSIPGDSLYPVKRISEQVVYQVTIDTGAKATLSLQYSERRLGEARALLELGKVDESQQVIAEYEEAVRQTVILLDQIPAEKAELKAQIAEHVQTQLATQANQLATLGVTAPEAVQFSLNRASGFSFNQAGVAQTIFNTAKGIEPTLTPTWMSTFMPSDVPSLTNPLLPGTTLTPQEGSGINPGNPVINPQNPAESKVTPTPTRNPRITNTPKPTNENRDKNNPNPPEDKKDPPGQGKQDPDPGKN